MIGYVEGKISSFTESMVLLDHNGLGFRIFVTPAYVGSHTIGQEVRIYTCMSVREDGITLFGFDSQDDLDMYRLLLTVSGVGPKAALSILSSLPADELRIAIATSDSARIAKAQGIGKKTAEKVVLELKDKMDIEEILSGTDAAQDVAVSAVTADSDAVAALIALGYPGGQALDAVRKAAAETGAVDTETLLKTALKYVF